VSSTLLAQRLSFEVQASGLEGVFVGHQFLRGKLDAIPDLLSLHHSDLLSCQFGLSLEWALLPWNRGLFAYATVRLGSAHG